MMLTEDDDNNKDYGNYTWIYSMLVLASDNIELSSRVILSTTSKC